MFTNSSLANYIDRSTGNYTKRTKLISKIMIHTLGKEGTEYDLSAYFSSKTKLGCNYGISTKGTVCLFIDEEDASHCTSNSDCNQVTVSIIVANSGTSKQLKISDTAYARLVELCTDICRRNFITSLKYTGDKTGNVLTYSMYHPTSTSPGAYVTKKLPSLCKDVNAKLKSTLLASSDESAEAAQSIINVNATNPFMALIDHSLTSVNYISLRRAGVSAVMFEAGSYFAAKHEVNTVIQNKNLKSQILDSYNAKLPYALCWTARARSIAEVKQECDNLYLILADYTPNLGIWLNLDFVNSVIVNDKLLKEYYKYFVKWGYTGRCGIIASKTQFKKFTWKTFSDEWALWLIGHTANLRKLQNLQVPEFFTTS